MLQEFLGAALNPEAYGLARLPRPKIYSDRIYLRFNFDYEIIDFGDIENFNFRSRDQIEIRKPCGYTYEIVTSYIPGGYDLSFTIPKSDFKLLRYFVDQSNLAGFSKMNNVDLNKVENEKIKYTAPNISLFCQVKHHNGMNELWQFTNLVLYNLETVINGDAGDVVETIKGFSPRLDIYTPDEISFTPINQQNFVGKVLDDMINSTYKRQTAPSLVNETA